METALPNIESIQFTFTKRPEPVPGDFRPRWKIAVIILSLHYCGRGPSGKSSINKLKVLSWASRDLDSQQALIRFLNDSPQPDDILLRHEPALVRALNLCAGLGLVQRNAEVISLSDTGLILIKDIIEIPDLLMREKKFLSSIAKQLTEEKTKILTEPQ